MKYIKQVSEDKEYLIGSVDTMRKWIGFLGLSLPAVLYFGSITIGSCSGVQESISHYYFTVMGDVLVGIICAISFFLILYKGPQQIDNITSTLAGLFALGVAFFPTDTNKECNLFPDLKISDGISSTHYICATLFFVSLCVICFAVFTRSTGFKTSEKKIRNGIFIGCGIVMLFSIIAIGLYHLLLRRGKIGSEIVALKPVFCLEALALAAFSISWLVKAEVVFKDSKESADEKERRDSSKGGLQLDEPVALNLARQEKRNIEQPEG